jgi:hypothetical protein
MVICASSVGQLLLIERASGEDEDIREAFPEMELDIPDLSIRVAIVRPTGSFW